MSFAKLRAGGSDENDLDIKTSSIICLSSPASEAIREASGTKTPRLEVLANGGFQSMEDFNISLLTTKTGYIHVSNSIGPRAQFYANNTLKRPGLDRSSVPPSRLCKALQHGF